MSETTKRIRDLARELYCKSTEAYPKYIPYQSIKLYEELQIQQIYCWEHLATHLHQEVIRGKIEELEHPRVPPLYVANRLRELKADLTAELEGE